MQSRVLLIGPRLLEPQTNTPKALADFSPGLERSDNPGLRIPKSTPSLKGLKIQRSRIRNKPFQGK
jgi:hypothetical protein